MNAEDASKLTDKILKNPAAYGIHDCILCGGKPITFVGLTIPEGDLAEKLKQPEGKRRVTYYGICERCEHLPNAHELIDEKMIADLDSGMPLNLLDKDGTVMRSDGTWLSDYSSEPNPFDVVDHFYERISNRETTLEEGIASRKRLKDRLINDPLLHRHLVYTETGEFRNTKPEHAFGERLFAAIECVLVSLGDGKALTTPIAAGYKPLLSPKNENVAANCALAIAKLSTVYLWKNDIERIADAAPLPEHTISRDVLPFPVMFWARETWHDEGTYYGSMGNRWLAVIHDGAGFYIVGDMNVELGNPRTRSPEIFLNHVPYSKLYPRDFVNPDAVEPILKRCAFLRSPYIVTERQRMPHHVRRQLERDHGVQRERLQDEMHVVKLRRLQIRKPQKPTGEHHEVDWQHQWWVSAHYRAQWYPTEQAHKVIWIAPFLKGPTDKPILEKIYAVIR
jgi:hypothetical protein